MIIYCKSMIDVTKILVNPFEIESFDMIDISLKLLFNVLVLPT